MRRKLIAGNWKMNHGPAATRAFFEELAPLVAGARPKTELCIAAPAVSLPAAVEAARAFEARTGVPIQIAAQNAHGLAQGAFTGEISAPMLKEIGVSLVLVGHSERRTLFGETDALIAARAQGILAQGLGVIYCVGETLAEREAGRTQSVLESQLRHVPWDAGEHLVIAYEPVWAIGTGVTATPDQAQDAHAFIRKHMLPAVAARTRILYGGSVTPENATSLLVCPDVDGALVGGASLKAVSFAGIVGKTPLASI